MLAAIDGGLLRADPGLPERLAGFAGRHAGLVEWVAAPVVVPGGHPG
jgi:hypothetical protein